MNDYEERIEEKRRRYAERAEKARQEGETRYKTAREIGSHIPLGQPILADHYSARGHRADLKRIDTNMRKSIEADEKAEHYARKAETYGTHGISSDDPEAIPKLKEKLARMEHNQDVMKKVNAAHRKGGWGTVRETGLLKPERVDQLMKAFVFHKNEKPFPSYALQNNNGNMRRVRQRIEQLEARQARAEEPDKETTHGDIRVVDNTEANRTQVFFPDKPNEEVRKALQRRGFRFSRRNNKAWQRHLSTGARYEAERIAERYAGAWE